MLVFLMLISSVFADTPDLAGPPVQQSSVQVPPPGRGAHSVVVAGRATALTGLGLTALSIPTFALTARCAFRQGSDHTVSVCDAPGLMFLGGLGATTVGAGMMVGGSLGYLSAAKRQGVRVSPAGGLTLLFGGLGALTVSVASRDLGINGGPWAGLGTLSAITGLILLDQSHMRARRKVGAGRIEVMPALDPVGRTVGITGRF